MARRTHGFHSQTRTQRDSALDKAMKWRPVHACGSLSKRPLTTAANCQPCLQQGTINDSTFCTTSVRDRPLWTQKPETLTQQSRVAPKEVQAVDMQALQKHSQLQEWADSHALAPKSKKRERCNFSYVAAACARRPTSMAPRMRQRARHRRACAPRYAGNPLQQACAERSPRA